MPRTNALVLAALATMAACAEAVPPDPGLHLTFDESSVDGSFVHGARVVQFRSTSSDFEQKATVELSIDGLALDVTLDRANNVLVEEAHGNTFDFEHRELLLALRDAASLEHPELMDSLHGRFLVMISDRFAEVPVGRAMARHEVDLAAAGRDSAPKGDAVSSGCGDDGVTCLPGESGTSWAVYSADGTCQAKATPYGDSICRGRCGIGCNWFDADYTYDCLDHDVCLDYSSDCGDEFNDAADDYVATLAPLCFGGTSRTKPPGVPVPVEKKLLVSDHSNKCVDVAGWNNHNGGTVQLYSCHGGANQQWTISALGDGTSKIVNVHSGKCLDLSMGDPSNGARIQQWDCATTDNQKWYVRSVGTSIALVSKVSGRCVDVAGWETADEARIQQWECHYGANQLWHRQ